MKTALSLMTIVLFLSSAHAFVGSQVARSNEGPEQCAKELIDQLLLSKGLKSEASTEIRSINFRRPRFSKESKFYTSEELKLLSDDTIAYKISGDVIVNANGKSGIAPLSGNVYIRHKNSYQNGQYVLTQCAFSEQPGSISIGNLELK